MRIEMLVSFGLAALLTQKESENSEIKLFTHKNAIHRAK
jgi:hypothetical protein